MNAKATIGLLPLYLKLYDEIDAGHHELFEPFIRQIAERLQANGAEVVRSGVCRVESEFKAAVQRFEQADVDCLVTVHLAYSPSLESVGVLCGSRLPVVILDTTMDAAFGPDVDPERIMYNHGIHGVMDLASMLRRTGKTYSIVAGHMDKDPVIERVLTRVHAARAAQCFRTTRAVRIGEPFKGMGDFSVEPSVLRDVLGIESEQVSLEDLAAHIEKVTDADVAAELASDNERFHVTAPQDVHMRTLRVCLGLRALLDEREATAFSMNFLEFDRPDGPTGTIPFLEASKAMARGIGYAGEGDLLSAALVGALSQGFGSTTFTEMFCPDWAGSTIFLSHMGEVNPDIAAATPRLVEKSFPFTPSQNPAILACSPRPGSAVFSDIVPGPDHSFSLIVAPVEILDLPPETMQESIRGWMRPRMDLARFLEEYSRLGGTHHSALTLGDRVEGIVALAQFAGISCTVLE